MNAPAHTEVRAQARAWVIRLADAEAKAADHLEFDAWLAADPRNAEAYQRAARTYSLVGELPYQAAHQPTPKLPTRSAAAWTAGVVGMALAAAFALALIVPRAAAPIRPDYATEVAEVREVRLDDGSTITLGAATALEVDFSDGARRVRIGDGEAYFQVAHDETRPFFVEAQGTIVRVVGTEFEVKATRDLVRVAVSRGIVEVNEPTRLQRLLTQRTHRLVAGEQVLISRHPTERIAVVETPRPPASWRDGFLIYDGATLAEVLADANRYSAVRIELADPSLADLRVTVSYPIEQIDQMLSSLDAGLPIDVERRGDALVRIVPAS